MDNLRHLWDLSQFNNLSKMAVPNIDFSPVTRETTKTVDNSITINGMTVDNGSSEGANLINALQRYIAIH